MDKMKRLVAVFALLLPWLTVIVGATLPAPSFAQQCGTLSTCPFASSPFDGTELFWLTQRGASRKVTSQNLAQLLLPLLPIVIPPIPSTVSLQVANVAELKQLNPALIPSTVSVQTAGYYLAGDRGGAYFTASTINCTLNGGAGDNGSQVKPNFLGCFKAVFGVGEPTILQFGALSDGTADISSAAIAATAFQVSGQCAIGIPTGLFLIRSGVVVNNSCALNLQGRGATVFTTDQPTGGLITLNGISSSMNGGFSIDSSVTRTSGNAITCNAPQCYIEKPYIQHNYRGFVATSGLFVVDDLECRNMTPAATAGGSGCGYVTSSGAANSTGTFNHPTDAGDPSNPDDFGILSDNSDALQINDPNLLLSNCGIELGPQTGQVVLSTKINVGYLDSNFLASLCLLPNGGALNRTTATATWMGDTVTVGAMNGRGILMSVTGGGTLDGFNCGGCQMPLNGQEGVFSSTSIPTDVQFTGGYCSGAIFCFAMSGDQWSIQGMQIGNYQALGSLTTQAIFLTGPLTNSIITMNSIKDAGTSPNIIGPASNLDGTDVVELNPGYNPIGPVPITLPASGSPAPAGPTSRTIYVTTGTFTATSGGVTVCSAVPCNFPLAAGQSFTPTYTGTPGVSSIVN